MSKEITVKIPNLPENFIPNMQMLADAAQAAVREELQRQLVIYFSNTTWGAKE